jgi:hypothetical protein
VIALDDAEPEAHLGFMVTTAAIPDIELVLNTKVALKRRDDHACGCGAVDVVVGRGTPPHAASLLCADCGRWRAWMPERFVAGLAEVTRRFGRPTVTLRNLEEHIKAHLGASAEMYLTRTQATGAKMPITAKELEELDGGKYFKGSDFPGNTKLELTVIDVTADNLKGRDGSMKRKAILHFKEHQKLLPLNDTNRDTIKGALGNEPKDWIEAKVSLWGDNTPTGRGVRLTPIVPDEDLDEGPPF